ncbi:hypothetical protein LZ31DRAFT_555396 [Colletotrichum somersetense]|nr:hypothetical protein LZ31DRAFT_555396 [Colletotrichum somersetense]
MEKPRLSSTLHAASLPGILVLDFLSIFACSITLAHAVEGLDEDSALGGMSSGPNSPTCPLILSCARCGQAHGKSSRPGLECSVRSTTLDACIMSYPEPLPPLEWTESAPTIATDSAAIHRSGWWAMFRTVGNSWIWPPLFLNTVI